MYYIVYLWWRENGEHLYVRLIEFIFFKSSVFYILKSNKNEEIIWLGFGQWRWELWSGQNVSSRYRRYTGPGRYDLTYQT